MESLRFLKTYIYKYKGRLAAGLLFLSFVSVSNLAYPWLFKLIIDNPPSGTGGMVNVAIGFVLIFTVSSVLGYFTFIIMQELGSRLRNDIRYDYYKTVLGRKIIDMSSEQVGEISLRAVEDIGKLQQIFPGFIVPLYQNIIFITGCVILMVMLDAGAALIVLALILLPIPVILYYNRKVRSYSAQAQKQHAASNAVLEESLVGLREIRAFMLEEKKLGEYSKHSEEALKNELQSARNQSKSGQLVYFILSASLIAIFYLGTSGFASWSTGEAVVFYFYAYALTMAFIALGRAQSGYQMVAGPLANIISAIQGNDAKIHKKEKSTFQKLHGEIEIKSVSFSYRADKAVLENISLEIKAGEWLLITGPSGSGKSTLAGLLMHFYQPAGGDILIDGKNINEIDNFSLRTQTGYVPQEPVLFRGTVRENVLCGREIQEERLLNILKCSMVYDFLSSLPEGLDTNIAERGISMSAGQKSRLAIARAIVNDPPVLILDEANSMLEEELEKQLWQNLWLERKDKTTIIFSHHIENIPKIYKSFHIG